jgi:hypothetical protein
MLTGQPQVLKIESEHLPFYGLDRNPPAWGSSGKSLFLRSYQKGSKGKKLYFEDFRGL